MRHDCRGVFRDLLVLTRWWHQSRRGGLCRSATGGRNFIAIPRRFVTRGDYDAAVRDGGPADVSLSTPSTAANPSNTLPERLCRRYFAGMVKGLLYLHSVGIVHRDVKPDNLLVNSENRCLLADFGCAMQLPRQGGAACVPVEVWFGRVVV